MHPIYQLDPASPAFDPLVWYNLIGAVGCVFWVIAYVSIVRQCFKERTYGLPMVAICLNFSWELLASFVFPNPVALWHLFDRLWLLIDVILVYQLLRYGRGQQTIPEIRKYFYGVVALTFTLGLIGQYTFVRAYADRLGLVVAFIVNLVMSVQFLFFYLSRVRSFGGAGINRTAAVCKMLGTLGTSIECHYVVRLIDPELASLAFLTFLSATIFVFDLLYVLMTFRTSAAPRPSLAPVAP